jgi:hypothetical protein
VTVDPDVRRARAALDDDDLALGRRRSDGHLELAGALFDGHLLRARARSDEPSSPGNTEAAEENGD